MRLLFPLLLAGLPGMLLGCLLSRYIPAQRLRAVIAVVAICAGLQLVVSDVKARVPETAKVSARSIGAMQRASNYYVKAGSSTPGN